LGSGQTYQWEFATNTSGTWTAIDTPAITPFLATTANVTAYYRAKVKCSSDSAYSDTVLVTVPAAFPGGTYTIDPSLPASSSNFQSFAAAISAISCGLAGHVTFNVAADTFDEQVILPATIGSN